MTLEMSDIEKFVIPMGDEHIENHLKKAPLKQSPLPTCTCHGCDFSRMRSQYDVTSSTIKELHEHKIRSFLLMQHAMQTRARIQKRWRQLAEDFQLPQAVWSKPKDAFDVWMLDPSEGPLRMRKRMVLTRIERDMTSVGRSPPKQVLSDEAGINDKILPEGGEDCAQVDDVSHAGGEDAEAVMDEVK